MWVDGGKARVLGDVALGLGLHTGVGLAEPPKAEAAAPSLPAPPPGEASGVDRPQLCSTQALHPLACPPAFAPGPFPSGVSWLLREAHERS